MCMTIGKEGAELSNTQIYVGEAVRDDKLVHVLAYQNTAESYGPNAMILPFPTSEPMGPNNIIDTRGFGKFLTDIGEATRMRMRSASFSLGSKGFGGPAAAGVAQVFDSGSYTVILADHVAQVPEALTRVPADKRPEITTQFLIRFGMMYPKQPVALCCWSGTLKSEPLLWIYEPKNPEVLFVPTMDAHDGGPPDLDAMVQTDHVISAGSRIVEVGSPVNYTDLMKTGGSLPSEFEGLLPSRVRGMKIKRMVKNGDMFISVPELRAADKLFIKRGAKYTTEGMDQEVMGGWT